MHVVGKLLIVECFGAFDGFAEQLEIGIAPTAEVIAERVDAFGLGALLILLKNAAAGAISFGDGTQVS